MSVTQYGFEWGPLKVERVAHIEGRGYVVSIQGPKGYAGPEVQVLVSEKGRKVTAYPMRGASARDKSCVETSKQEKPQT